MSIIYCKHCNTQTLNPKFCSSSCSASFNNKGKRRHGKEPGLCLVCDQPKSSYKRKYCSNKCQRSLAVLTPEQKRARGRETFMRYYSRKKYNTPIDEDKKALIKFYENCPEGYEVDHIIPISKGGKHSITNLQYLTILENRKKSNKVVCGEGFEPPSEFL